MPSITLLYDDLVRRDDLDAFLSTIFPRTLRHLGLTITKEVTFRISIANKAGNRQVQQARRTELIETFQSMLKDHDTSLTSAIHLPCLHICFETISLIKDTVWEKVAVESKTIKAEYLDTDWYADRTD